MSYADKPPARPRSEPPRDAQAAQPAEARQSARDHLRLLAFALEDIDEGILLSEDHDDWKSSRIIFANAAAERLTGIDREALIGNTPAALLERAPQSAELDRLKLAEIQHAPFRGHLTYQLQDGALLDVSLVISGVRDERGEFTHYVALQRDVTERNVLKRRLLDVATTEQTRIGRAIHDGPLQELTGLRLSMSALAFKQQRLHSKTAGDLERLNDQVTQISDHLRQLSRGLVPDYVEGRDLAMALGTLASTINESTAFECVIALSGYRAIESDLVIEQLYLIAREAAWNAVTHSRGSRVEVRLDRNAGGIHMQIIDDGVGFESNTKSRGIGIPTMHYRSEAIGASFKVNSAPQRGTVVDCRIGSGQIARLANE